MNSGNAVVVPLVASEKNVEACVVSSESDHVYEPWNDQPAESRRRTSTMNALYQESPSDVFASIVVQAVLMRGRFAAKNGWPSAPMLGAAVLRSLLRNRFMPREPA